MVDGRRTVIRLPDNWVSVFPSIFDCINLQQFLAGIVVDAQRNLMQWIIFDGREPGLFGVLGSVDSHVCLTFAQAGFSLLRAPEGNFVQLVGTGEGVIAGCQNSSEHDPCLVVPSRAAKALAQSVLGFSKSLVADPLRDGDVIGDGTAFAPVPPD